MERGLGDHTRYRNCIFNVIDLGIYHRSMDESRIKNRCFSGCLRTCSCPEFRAEVSRIIGYKLLCEKHSLLVEINIAEDHLVKVVSSTERVIRNKSSDPQSIKN